MCEDSLREPLKGISLHWSFSGFNYGCALAVSATAQVRKQLEKKIVGKLMEGEQKKLSRQLQRLLSSKFKYNA